MKNIIIIIVLLLGTNTLAVSQTDTLPRPTSDTTDFSEGYKEYTGEYTNDEEKARKKWTEMDIPIAAEFALGASHMFMKDNLTSSYANSGYGLHFILYGENINNEKYWVNISTGLYAGSLSRNYTTKDILIDDLSDYDIQYFDAHIPFNFGFRLKQSPHYIGFHIGAVLASTSFLSPEEYFYVVSDSYFSAGVTYFYKNNLLGVPIRAYATLPIFTLVAHTGGFNSFTKFTTAPNHLNPTMNIDLFEKKLKKKSSIKVSYQCKYLNTNRGVDLTFRQRHFQNLINVSYRWVEE